MNKRVRAGLLVLIVQILLVLTIAGKYLYERKMCPRIWTRATMYDPSTPLRGRYLALSLQVDACALPHERRYAMKGWEKDARLDGWRWHVKQLAAKDGRLVAMDATDDEIRPRGKTYAVSLATDVPCAYGQLEESVEDFVPEHAASPFPLKPGNALWAEVTVPPAGNPRPIQLHVWPGGAFNPRRVSSNSF